MCLPRVLGLWDGSNRVRLMYMLIGQEMVGYQDIAPWAVDSFPLSHRPEGGCVAGLEQAGLGDE